MYYQLCWHACNRNSCTQKCSLHDLACNECLDCNDVWGEMSAIDQAAARGIKADDPNKARKSHTQHRSQEELRQTKHGPHDPAGTEAQQAIRRSAMKHESYTSCSDKHRKALVGKRVVVKFAGHGDCAGVVESHCKGNKYYVRWDCECTADCECTVDTVISSQQHCHVLKMRSGQHSAPHGNRKGSKCQVTGSWRRQWQQ